MVVCDGWLLILWQRYKIRLLPAFRKDTIIINIIMVKLNFNLTLACSILVYFSLIFTEKSQASHVSFYFTHKCMRVIKLLLNLFMSNCNKCESHHEHAHKLSWLTLDKANRLLIIADHTAGEGCVVQYYTLKSRTL